MTKAKLNLSPIEVHSFNTSLTPDEKHDARGGAIIQTILGTCSCGDTCGTYCGTCNTYCGTCEVCTVTNGCSADCLTDTCVTCECSIAETVCNCRF